MSQFNWQKAIKRGLLISPLLVFILFLLLDRWFPLALPKGQQHFAQVVLDSQGEPLRYFADSRGVWRYPVSLDQVSPYYLEALLNYEDQYFFQHLGVNPLAIGRAAIQWIDHGKLVSGGSTITMQVARILHPHSRTISGKLHQMFRAFQLEWHLSKSEILELYLNFAPFGGPIEGVQAASFAYFNKTVSQLTRAEAALLAILPQAPSLTRPDRFPDKAAAAREKVINRLTAMKIWTEKQSAEALLEPIYSDITERPMLAPLLARKLISEFPQKPIIKTYIDRNLQIMLELNVADYAEQLSDKTSIAVVVTESSSGKLLGYVGSAEFASESRFGYVDMAQAIRSPGSTLKPFVYAQALDAGLIHERSLMIDAPIRFADYAPLNFDRQFLGAIDAGSALQQSLNVPAVHLLDQIKPTVFYSQLAHGFLQLELPLGAEPNLSMILGGVGTRLVDLTQSFSALGNQGLVQPIKWQQEQTASFARPLMSAEAAWIVGNRLADGGFEDAIYRHNLTGFAVKTGTSYGLRDAWVLASNASVSIGIWIGRPDGTPLPNNVARINAVPLLKKMVAQLPSQFLKKPVRPETVIKETICWPLGLSKNLTVPDHCLKQYSAWLIEGATPPTLADPNLVKLPLSRQSLTLQCDNHQSSLTMYPLSLEPYLAKHERRTERVSKCRAKANTPIQLIGLTENAELFVGPKTLWPLQLPMELQGTQSPVFWFLNSELIPHQEPKLTLSLTQPGSYQLIAMDAFGNRAEKSFTLQAPSLATQ